MNSIDASPFRLDRGSGAPLYRQLVDQLTDMIRTGKLPPASTLWPERNLSEMLEVSRGTVRKAYSMCKDAELLTVVQGGNYRVADNSYLHQSPEQKAMRLSHEYLIEMEALGYDRNASIDMLRLNHNSQAQDNSKIRVGMVECRRSMFYVFENILNNYTDIETTCFLMDELNAFPEIVKQAEQCDMLLVTAAHYYELCETHPELEPKMLEVALTWNEDTISEICKIPREASVGILYSSVRTVFVIKSALHTYSVDCDVDVCNINSQYTLDTFLRNKQVLIIEPTYDAILVAKYESEWDNFYRRGGRRIIFQHNLLPSSVRSIQHKLLKIRESRG